MGNDVDVDGEAEDTGDATPAEEEEDEEEEEVEAATPATQEEDDEDDDEEGDNDDDAEDDEPVIISIPRRRGRGRGRPRGSRKDFTLGRGGENASESGTPYRRRGRKPGSGRARGGGRGRGRRGPEPAPRVVDENGRIIEVLNGEALVDDDVEGNEKVDEMGNLQGGREYRVRTFKINDKGDRLYMLSTEPARCCGFRDSYLFFTKHPKLFKVLLSVPEKEDLIAREILPNSYKGRNIGVVTARSVFREFGARIIVGGKKVTDDYKVTEARLRGELEGEPADPDDIAPGEGQEYNRNRYVAWFGASDVYRQAAAAGGVVAPPRHAGPGVGGRRKNNVTVDNWQTLHAREASRFNSTLAQLRQTTMNGVYDTHTNMMFYPKITQPTHAKWERIPPPLDHSQKPQRALTNGTHHLTNGDAHLFDSMDLDTDDRSQHTPTNFPPVPPIISRNFLVTDIHYSAPPLSNTGYPGPDGIASDLASGAGGTLSSIRDDILDELDETCRREFETARKLEVDWKAHWGTEAQSAGRRDLKISFAGYPV
ncbi:hypothetical protein K431DRAFT_233945 [Polychaeton citri CBS 116435]|uniref:Nuclear localization protein n=1 Tax=Polychaeton citri CBS 116435 TaxID=1314669 RepID=A0A9P4Q080_9PEZI|nr:hypothetical protein K431DRAFT_233945 [Polychaeton citri CBS 116435]